MYKKIIILGATGQVGTAIFDYLRRYYSFFVVGTSRFFHKEKEIVSFDPFNDDWNVLGKADVLINCVGIIRPTGKNNFEKIHVRLAALMIENRNLLGDPLIIQLSALGASSGHAVDFLRTKGLADDLILKYSRVFVIRPSIVCTPNTMLVKKLRMIKKILPLLYNVLPVPEKFPATHIQPVAINDLTDLIMQLIINKPPKAIINAVGPERLSFRQLINILPRNKQENIILKEVSRKFTDRIVKYVLSPLFPGLINMQQYQLLFMDNSAEINTIETILGRKLVSTRSFWENELQD